VSSQSPTVAAVGAGAVASGVSGQTRRPELVFAGDDALERAIQSSADWIWLLARGADPRADALERLLALREPPDERPASLLAGMVRNASGITLASQLPAGDERHPQLIRLAAKRMLPIRSAPFVNCLVARDCFVRHGLPDAQRYGPYADVEWSARVLRAHAGYFIPSSVVVLEQPVRRRDQIRAIPALVRMLGTGALTRGESLALATSWMRRATP
jgi:hypothetical protein